MSNDFPYKHPPFEKRLLDRIVPEPNSGCHLWIGPYDKNGYGKISNNGKHLRAHRAIFELEKGPIPPGMLIQHKCDNPSCCNIKHLELGTWLTNMQDKVKKGRLRNQHMNKTHCIRGHEFTKENTKVYSGKRVCYTCLANARGYKSRVKW